MNKILCWLGWHKPILDYQVVTYYDCYDVYCCEHCGTNLGRHDDEVVQFNFYSNHPKIL